MITNPNRYFVRLGSVLLPGLVSSRVTSSSHLTTNVTVAHLKKASAVCYCYTTATREIESRKLRTCVDDGEQSFAC
jgi:hypothetical protein